MQVKLREKVKKELIKINEPDRSRIEKGLLLLSKDPPQGDIKKLSGFDSLYRLRIGNYRLLFYYEFDEFGQQHIFVFKMDLRGQVYKGV
jgi:mRNA interferase RelE/StbE